MVFFWAEATTPGARIGRSSTAEPADNSIGRHSDACCAICKNVDNDAWDATDPGLVCHNCLACKQWWHLECQPEDERETTELADPMGRCAECIADSRYALNRILDLARLETGQYRLLLEYIGYDFYELDKPSTLAIMGRVGREAMVEAYQRHEITRETRSLLFCVQALIDALDLGESLKTYGLRLKMTHDDPKLYLIGHASLEKRGLDPSAKPTSTRCWRQSIACTSESPFHCHSCWWR
jgi:hypothetical protein